MDLLINNKVAFIAASSQGLGYAVAKELLQEGCHVIISGRDAKNLEQAAQTWLILEKVRYWLWRGMYPMKQIAIG